jgi:quercetin dioxygenase-like cupin family protein
MPAPEIRPFKRPDWEPLPFEGAANVEGRVFDEKLGLAILRFGVHGHIHPHAGPNDTVVSCLEGHGFTRVGEDVAELRSGEMVLWPEGLEHALWTEDSTMTTLMCERPPACKDEIYAG